jgi:hypothetical protein
VISWAVSVEILVQFLSRGSFVSSSSVLLVCNFPIHSLIGPVAWRFCVRFVLGVGGEREREQAAVKFRFLVESETEAMR